MSTTSSEKTLNLFPIDYPFETLVARITAPSPKLKLNPDFQRKYKWAEDGWERSSRFIESCLMRIPLPSCYFAEEEDGTHMVIDGVQRLTTITKFFNNEFQLEGLTTFKELDGKKFNELGSLRTDLETTTIRCIVLRKDNPKRLIREIFSRLNQGAVKLSDQEIRHALYPGELDILLAELALDPIISRFGLGSDTNVTKTDLEPEEQVLRYFAFSDDKNLEKYGSRLKDFLDQYMETNQHLNAEKIQNYRIRFKTALKNCIDVFKEDVFVNPVADRKRKGLLHYDLIMTTVGELDESKATEKAAEIRAAYVELCNSEEFNRTLSGGLQNKGRVQKRRILWESLLNRALNEVQ